jgi:RNA polymerase sigma-70 factor (ECF subfamily)
MAGGDRPDAEALNVAAETAQHDVAETAQHDVAEAARHDVAEAARHDAAEAARQDVPADPSSEIAVGEDRALVSRFLERRDEAAFRALYDRHSGRLYRFLLRLTGRAADAEEGVQETWVRACRSLERFAWRSALSTWLAGIAIRWWREECRRRGRVTDGDAAEPEVLAGLAPASRGEIDRIDLERALGELALGYREAILLHDVFGHTHGEIAELLEVDEGTSKSQLSRARRLLRARLGGRRT